MSDVETADAKLRRVVAAATAAIAERRDLSISFAAEPPQMNGERLQLPQPQRNPSAIEVAELRGAADAFAVRLRHHDERTHTASAPAGLEARAAFDA